MHDKLLGGPGFGIVLRSGCHRDGILKPLRQRQAVGTAIRSRGTIPYSKKCSAEGASRHSIPRILEQNQPFLVICRVFSYMAKIFPGEQLHCLSPVHFLKAEYMHPLSPTVPTPLFAQFQASSTSNSVRVLSMAKISIHF